MISSRCKNHIEKYFFTFGIILLLATVLYSQITVTQTQFMHLFTPGNFIYAIPGESGLVNVGNYQGPNIYDFTQINTQNQLTMQNYEISQISQLSGRYPSNASTFGGSPQNIDGHPVFLSEPDSTYLVGDVLIGSEYQFSHYVPIELFYGFPINYGDLPSWSAFQVYDTTYNLNWQILSTYFYNEYVHVSVDGYGTLRLPGRDLECLRMVRRYSWFQYKEFFFLTREGTMVVVSDVDATEPDTGYVSGDYIVLTPDPFVSIEDYEASISLEYRLEQNYPNPFNPTTRLTYYLHKSSFVELKVYDLSGRSIYTLVKEYQSPGEYSTNFNGSNLSSGIYFYQLNIGSNQVMTKKMVLMR